MDWLTTSSIEISLDMKLALCAILVGSSHICDFPLAISLLLTIEDMEGAYWICQLELWRHFLFDLWRQDTRGDFSGKLADELFRPDGDGMCGVIYHQLMNSKNKMLADKVKEQKEEFCLAYSSFDKSPRKSGLESAKKATRGQKISANFESAYPLELFCSWFVDYMRELLIQLSHYQSFTSHDIGQELLFLPTSDIAQAQEQEQERVVTVHGEDMLDDDGRRMSIEGYTQQDGDTLDYDQDCHQSNDNGNGYYEDNGGNRNSKSNNDRSGGDEEQRRGDWQDGETVQAGVNSLDTDETFPQNSPKLAISDNIMDIHVTTATTTAAQINREPTSTDSTAEDETGLPPKGIAQTFMSFLADFI